MMVVFGHINNEYCRHFEPGWFNRFPVFHYGWTGVDLFFVLSGFLIGKQLWQELAAKGTISVLPFIIRRGLRIWPLYYCFLLFLIFVLRTEKASSYKLWPDFFFFTNYERGLVSGGWSLSTEEQFYLLIPLLFVAVLRFLNLQRHGLILLGLLMALPLVRWFVISNTSVEAKDLIYTPIHTHCDGLIMGLILAWLAVSKPQYFIKRSFRVNFVFFISAAIVAYLLRSFQEDVFSFLSLAIIYGVCVFCSLKNESFYSRNIAGWHGFHIVSRLSYGMYLIHFEVLPKVTVWIAKHFHAGEVAFVLTLLFCTVASMIFALIGYGLIEFPFLVLRSRWLKSRRLTGEAKC